MDWVQVAAASIHDALRWWTWNEWNPSNIEKSESVIRTIILQHSPFKDGVAYMPVPRCETCEHWSGGSRSDGVCAKVIQLNGMLVPKDFGCVKHKEK